MQDTDLDRIWGLYQNGIEFKSSIGLYDTVDKNERFYAGDQWAGISAPDLPKPVVNFIKRACQQKIASVKENPTKVSFIPFDYPTAPDIGDGSPETRGFAPFVTEAARDALAVKYGRKKAGDPLFTDTDADTLNAMFEMDWGRLDMDGVNLDGLLDACVSGDYILYTYWNPAAETGQRAKGQVEVSIVDNVNYYPTNPNERDPQKQPSMIIARRELVSGVKAEAKKYGASKAQLERIAADGDSQYQAGDLAQSELQNEAGDKCITLIYLWRDPESGRILAIKTTRDAVVRPEWDTLLTRYPLAVMNWDLRKNCCHGRAEITGLIPNQHYVNFMYALIGVYTMNFAFPKVIYSKSSGLNGWTSSLYKPIAVQGDINAAAKYLQPGAMSAEAMAAPEKIMQDTLSMMGTSDISLGNVNPTNTSALMAAISQSQVPVQSIQTRFYRFIKDFARNWLDMVCAYYTVSRFVTLKNDDGGVVQWVFDPAGIANKSWMADIEVGQGLSWNESVVINTLSAALQSGQITYEQYLRGMPKRLYPERDKLLAQMEGSKAAPDTSGTAGSAQNGKSGAGSSAVPQMPFAQMDTPEIAT